ncbi:MAG TPA: MATE family efflux transporter [Limnochordia bacterium]
MSSRLSRRGPQRVHAELIRLTIPTLIATLAVPIVGLLDTFFLGHLPEPTDLAGAAAAGAILNNLLWVFGFLRMGTVGLVAHAAGRQDAEGAARVLFQALLLAAGAGVALIALQGPIARIGLWVMGAAPKVTAKAELYFRIAMLQAPFALALYGVNGYLRGWGDAVRPMQLTFLIGGINAALDALLVPGWAGLPAWGAAGAAAASVIAIATGSLCGIGFAWRRARRAWDWGWLRRWRRLPWRPFLAIQFDLLVRTLLLVVTLGAVTVLAARLPLPRSSPRTRSCCSCGGWRATGWTGSHSRRRR